ncbi:MAG: hypothetical protein QM811_29830 [Pirellulales bacterium]
MARRYLFASLAFALLAGVGALFASGGVGKAVAAKASCKCCVAAGCTGEGCSCVCETCDDNCTSCADCCGYCPACGPVLTAAKASTPAVGDTTPAVCVKSCCAAK